MGLIVDFGKTKIKEILTDAYFYAIEQTNLHEFDIDNQDNYPRGVVVTFLSKKDKLDWGILEQIELEVPWFSANRHALSLRFELPDYNNRHDKEIFFQSKIAASLNENGLLCYSDISYHD